MKSLPLTINWAVPFSDRSKPAAGYPVIDEAEHQTLYLATEEVGVYHHHPCIAYAGDRFYAAWSSHVEGEDGPGQFVIGMTSANGRDWSRWATWIKPLDTQRSSEENGRVLTPVALVEVDGVMHVVAEVHDNIGFTAVKGMLDTAAEVSPVRTKEMPSRARKGYGRMAAPLSPDGQAGEPFWLVADPPTPIDGFPAHKAANDPSLSQKVHAINAILATPEHQPSWEFRNRATRAFADDGHVMAEPTVYRRHDGVLVRLARDADKSHRIYASFSTDEGQSWTTPTATDVPDAPSKSFAGSLPDGRNYVVGNFVSEPFDKATTPHYRRDPLVLAVSKDGVTFDWAQAIVHDAKRPRLGGKGKGGPGFAYPHAVVANGSLWVIYSLAKEDIALSRVPLNAIGQA